MATSKERLPLTERVSRLAIQRATWEAEIAVDDADDGLGDICDYCGSDGDCGPDCPGWDMDETEELADAAAEICPECGLIDECDSATCDECGQRHCGSCE